MNFKSLINFSILICLFLIASVSYAQDAFQRLYTTEDRTLINMGSIPTVDGGFYMLNLAVDNSDQQSINLIQLSRNNPKGNLEWTKEFTLRDKTLVTNLKSIDIEQTYTDTLVVTGMTQILGTGAIEDDKFVFKLDPATGDILWSGVETDAIDQLLPITLPAVAKGVNNQFITFNTHGNTSGDTLGLQRIQYNSNNEVVSKRAYLAQLDNQPFSLAGLLDVATTIDSNQLVSVLADINQNLSSFMLLDTVGDIKSSFSYSISIDSILSYQMQATSVAATQDTALLMSGFVVNLLTNGVSNFLIKADTSGNIQWSKFIDASDQGLISQVNDVAQLNDGTIALSGKYQNIASASVGDFIIYFDADGNVVKQVDYGSENSFFFVVTTQGVILFIQGEMGATSDGGLLYSTTGIDPATNAISPYIIKTDPAGDAFCSDTLDFDLVRDFAFIKDTLVMGEGDYALTDTLVVIEDEYKNFSIPVLQLIDTFYCPQDPIMQTIDATLEGATMYEWSTGETTSSIFVTEEGMFSVTVTLGEKVCYTLCDTSTITQREFPEASINPDFSGFCALGEISLNASSTTDIVSVIWESGEMTNSIITTTPGLFSVTITDSCENTAAAEITITESAFDPEATLSSDFSSLCELSSISLEVNYPIDLTSIIWSNGEDSEMILVTQPGTYSVTVTDICNDTSVASIDISDDDFIFDPNLDINIGQPREVCDGTSKSVILTAEVTSISNDYEVMWSGNQIGEQIAVTEPGTYSVTLTNACGEMATASVDVSSDLFEEEPPTPTIESIIDSLCNITLVVEPNVSVQVIGFPRIEWSDGQTTDTIAIDNEGLYTVTVSDGCGGTGTAEINAGVAVDSLSFPDLFFPNSPSNITINKTFGPYIPCENLNLNNYKLEVFNRFGNRVFESERTESRWPGTFSGSIAPRDVYMYQYSFDNANGVEVTGSGTITLYR